MIGTTRYLLESAAETYGVPLPDYLVEAQSFLAAAQTYKAEVVALEAPDLASVTATTIAETVDQVLAFGQRDERLRLACRVESIAEGALDFALQRFRVVLLYALAAPFDKAATAFMAAHDARATQNPKVVATLTDLVAMRDALAGRVGEGLPAVNLDLPTRIATFTTREDIVRRAKLRTQGLDRGSQPYLEAILSIDGCRLRWQTTDQQAAHVRAIPAGGDSILAGGDAA